MVPPRALSAALDLLQLVRLVYASFRSVGDCGRCGIHDLVMMQTAWQRMHLSFVSALFFVLHGFLYPAVAASTVPYTPSHVLVSPVEDSLVYLLLPESSAEDGQANSTSFLSLNVSENVDVDNSPYTTLLDQAPFLSADPTVPFVPVVDQQGNIKVYTGDCQNASNPSMLWQFTPDPDSSIGNGTWEKFTVKAQNDTSGPNYLSGGFAYAPTDTAESSVYSFGGMCPDLKNATANWISAANYSDTTIKLVPSDSGSSYKLDSAGQRAPPVAEAGFSVTPLQPSYTNSKRDGQQQKQQDFLVIGGQTQEAFLNMSELAIYSLPQDGWSFVDVQSGSVSAKTELTVRETDPKIEPRSGHTAVLSSDGSKVIVLGGWVENTSTPANPQLIVLELAAGYGGYGQWTWTVPDSKDSFLADGAGIYGHGAAVLPGDVMMIAGGSSISKSPSKRSTSNSQVHFYNLTSNSWATSYTNPNWNPTDQSQSQSQSHKASGSLSTAQKIGIGVGVGVGVPFLLIMGFLLFWCSRRYRFRRKRDSDLRDLALGAQRAHFWGQNEPEMSSSIRGPSRPGSDQSYPWNSNRSNGTPKRPDSGDTAVAEQTGLLSNGPVSKMPIRLVNSPPSCRFVGEQSRHDTFGSIHPIDERDELEASATDSLIAHDPQPTPPPRPSQGGLLEDVEIPDPFLDAPFLTPQSTIVDPENSLETFNEQQSLAGMLTGKKEGRATPSPTKERPTSTNSNLPSGMRLGIVPKSRATVLQGPSHMPSNGRSSPSKSVAASSRSKDTTERVRADSAATGSSGKRYSSDSFSTAYTTLSQRQAEGERLLHSGTEETSLGSAGQPFETPSKVAATSRPKASEWMGSMRRVFTGGRRWGTSEKKPNDSKANSFASLASGVDRRSAILESNGHLNPTDTNGAVPPRRAVSASAELLRRKQGAKDWGASSSAPRASPTTPSSSSHGHESHTEADAMIGASDEEYDSDEWDIESAAENRRVQVMFTVPKERLRVVNATARDLENASQVSLAALGSKNRRVSG